MLAELNSIVSGRFVILRDEQNPSSAASNIAASPSNNRTARKMKMSEIETDDSKRKKFTTLREPIASVTTVSKANCNPSCECGAQYDANKQAIVPALTISHMYGFTKPPVVFEFDGFIRRSPCNCL